MMKGGRCTIIVCSNDMNCDLWDPFFKLIEVYWSDNPFPIVLNTPSKSYSYKEMNISCYQLYPYGEEMPFGKRIRGVLDRINTNYILLLLDDHFLHSSVNTREIVQLLDWMDADESIMCFNFEATNDSYDIDDGKYLGYVRRSRYGAFRYNLSPAIWRRKAFMESWLSHETPWEWESYGTMRSWDKDMVIYRRKLTHRAPIEFDPTQDAIRGGKWNLEVVKDLFSNNGIEVDYDIRGTEYYPTKKYLRKSAIFKETTFFRAVHSIAFFLSYKFRVKILKKEKAPYSFNKYSDALNRRYYASRTRCQDRYRKSLF